ncbi:MAG: hypothetical protein KatS3mg115_0959 [Candidatus Poribacteria bacterium]|nr:MAG: hypothetical protein KatS3mg115_0959 [Candidatus Poribacteria bacterium]
MVTRWGLILLIEAGIVAMTQVGSEAQQKFPFGQSLGYRVWIGEAPAGWMELRFEDTLYEGRPAVRSELTLELTLRRSGTPVALRRVRTAYFDQEAPYRPYVLTALTEEPAGVRRAECRFQEGKVLLRLEIEDRAVENELPAPATLLLEEALPYYLWAEPFSEPGEQRRIALFNSDVLRPIWADLRFLGEELSPIGGRTVPARRYRQRLDWMGGVVTEEWYSPSGGLLRMDLAMGGLPLRLERVWEPSSVPDLQELPEVDLLVATRIPTAGRPERPDRLRALLRLEDGSPWHAESIPHSPRQQVRWDPESGAVLVEVQQDPVPERPAPFPLEVSDPTLQRYLQPSAFVEANDPQIVQAAQEIVAGAANAWQAAERIARWVYQHVNNKGLDQGFATAKETLQSRAGDCTEHTMLAIALSRAAGIPARILAGIVWQNDGFYYHFWHEVWVGEWIALDATLGQAPADAAHIQLSPVQFESETALEFGEGIFRTLNRLSIHLLPPAP